MPSPSGWPISLSIGWPLLRRCAPDRLQQPTPQRHQQERGHWHDVHDAKRIHAARLAFPIDHSEPRLTTFVKGACVSCGARYMNFRTTCTTAVTVSQSGLPYSGRHHGEIGRDVSSKSPHAWSTDWSSRKWIQPAASWEPAQR